MEVVEEPYEVRVADPTIVSVYHVLASRAAPA